MGFQLIGLIILQLLTRCLIVLSFARIDDTAFWSHSKFRANITSEMLEAARHRVTPVESISYVMVPKSYT